MIKCKYHGIIARLQQNLSVIQNPAGKEINSKGKLPAGAHSKKSLKQYPGCGWVGAQKW
jgi:hypothetical protein